MVQEIICVNGGDTLQGRVGFVLLNNQDPREIGTIGDLKAGTTYEHKDMDVVMQFTKVESIDVLIRALEEAKKCMGVNIEIPKDKNGTSIYAGSIVEMGLEIYKVSPTSPSLVLTPLYCEDNGSLPLIGNTHQCTVIGNINDCSIPLSGLDQQ